MQLEGFLNADVLGLKYLVKQSDFLERESGLWGQVYEQVAIMSTLLGLQT